MKLQYRKNGSQCHTVKIRQPLKFCTNTRAAVNIIRSSSSSLLTCTASMFDVTSENDAVGLAAPRRTGAISELAVSHSSSMAMLIRAWNTRLHFINGWEILTLLHRQTDRQADTQSVTTISYTSSSSLFGMHHQCVAPLAANSLHSGLFRASSIASSKVRLC